MVDRSRASRGRPERPLPRQPSARRSTRGAVAAACALLAGFAAPVSAPAAVFDLKGGAVVDGDIVRLGDRFFVLSTGLGYQILPRDSVRAVNIRVGGGAVEVGALVDWRAGVYQLKAPDGALVVARNGAVLARRAAPPPTADDRPAPTPPPTGQSRSVAAAMALRELPTSRSPAEAPSAAPTGAEAAAVSPETLLARGADAGGDVRAALTAVILGAEDGAAPAPDGDSASAAELDALARASLAALSGSGAPAAQTDSTAATDEVLAADPAPAPLSLAAIGAGAAAPPPIPPAPRPRTGAAQPAGAAIRARPADAQPDPFGDRRYAAWPLGAAYRDAVLGRLERRHAPNACAALAGLDAPLGGATDAIGAASALTLGAHYGLASGALATIVQGFFDEADVSADLTAPSAVAGRGGARPVWRARQSGGGSLLRPARLTAHQASAAILAERVRAGALHVAIGPRAMAAGRPARLVAFEPLAVAAHASSTVRRLSLSTLRLLVTGGARKMQAIGGEAVTLYLPPVGSAEARQFRDLLGVERIQPYSARFVADPAARVAAAAADPNGVVVASITLVGLERALAIGEPGEPTAKPSVEAVRTGAYPLVRPLYLISSDGAAHALAETLVAYFDGEAAGAAMSRVGLLPASGCANGDCQLAAPGLGAARERAGRGPAPLSHGVLASPAAASLGEMVFSPAFTDFGEQIGVIDQLLQAGLRPPSGGVALRLTPLSLSTERVFSADPAIQQAIAYGRRRAEAVALALRCAEIEVMGVTRPQGAPSDSQTAWRIEIVDAAR